MKVLREILFLSAVLLVGCSPDSEEKGSLPSGVELHWLFNDVDAREGSSKADFVIVNNGETPLTGSDWSLYFSQIYPPATVVDETLPFRVETITGDYRKIVPTDEFSALNPGDSLIIPVRYNGFAGRASYVPKGAYIASGEEDVQPVAITCAFPANNSEPIISNIQWEASVRYGKNSRGFNMQQPAFGMVPSPRKLELSNRQIIMRQGIEIGCPTEFLQEGQLLADDLREVFTGNINVNENATGGHIIFSRGTMPDPEGYSINTDNGIIEIIAATGSGALYASRSLMRMVEISNYENPTDQLTITAVNIEDFPRFAYRGLHLDVSRNFLSQEKVMRIIDQMAHYKLNKLLITLTNDEGWRIEIPGLPELTVIGAKRGHTLDENDMLYPAYGSGPLAKEDQFFTRVQFIEILKYASMRHINVIPEIDMPGHARAAIIAMKERSARAGKEGDDSYLLHDPDDTSEYTSAQNYSDNVVCVCRESTYDFIEKVVAEVMGMYADAGLKPEAIHSGGDEIPYGAWQSSPMCADLIARTSSLSGTDDLQQYFLERFIAILQPYNIEVAGWEEIVLETDEKGHNTTEINFDLQGSAVRPYVWNSVWGWGREDMAYKLANAGYRIVMCNSGSLYFDLAYESHPAEPGLTWSGFVNAQSAFEFAPYNMFATATRDKNGEPLDEAYIQGRTTLNAAAKDNILGIQAQLWGETLDDGAMLDYYLFPKLLGLAERAWADEPEWTTPANKSDRLALLDAAWSEFAAVTGWAELPRLDHLFGGTAYRIPLPGAEFDNGTLRANTRYPNFIVRYTTDGNDPDTTSMRVESSVRLDDGGEVRVRVFGRGGRSGHVLRLGGESGRQHPF